MKGFALAALKSGISHRQPIAACMPPSRRDAPVWTRAVKTPPGGEIPCPAAHDSAESLSNQFSPLPHCIEPAGKSCCRTASAVEAFLPQQSFINVFSLIRGDSSAGSALAADQSRPSAAEPIAGASRSVPCKPNSGAFPIRLQARRNRALSKKGRPMAAFFDMLRRLPGGVRSY